jgi:hypothetical protein
MTGGSVPLYVSPKLEYGDETLSSVVADPEDLLEAGFACTAHHVDVLTPIRHARLLRLRSRDALPQGERRR